MVNVPVKDPGSRAEKTFRNDSGRALCSGILDSGWQTFGVLIAIRLFQAPETIKALFFAADKVGMLLTSITIAFASRWGRPATRIIGTYALLAAVFLILSALSPGLWLYATFFCLAAFTFAQQLPLMIKTYSQNYTRQERGLRVSSASILTAIGGMLASISGGWILDLHLDWYRIILLGMAGAAAAYAAFAIRIPSEPLHREDTGNLLKNIPLIWSDRLFGWMLGAWMVMGVGNLMTLPIRVEYLANPSYGINATNAQVALLTFFIPSAARVVSARIWGTLFDSMHFVTWRITINSFFIAGFLIYFNATTLPLLALGSALFGFATGGGFVGWNLWITKIAPSHKVSAYMSLHTMTTGLRGAVAPFLGYALLVQLSPSGIAWISSALVLASMAMFLVVKRHSRFDQDHG